MSGPRPADGPSIDVVGADANNLCDVDVAFPLGRITVVSGVSGSGKSSLLADTLAAEGARRTRTFLDVSQREVEQDGVRAFVGRLPPTVLVGQRGFRPSVRTTIGTATGFLSALRKLFVRASVPHSDRTGEDVPAPSPESYAGWIARHYRGSADVWAIPVRDRATDGVDAVERLAAQGIETVSIFSASDPTRLRATGRKVDPKTFKGLSPGVSRTVEGLVGRVEVGATAQEESLRGLLRQAFEAGNGSVVVMLPAAVDSDLAGPFGTRLDSEHHWVHPSDPAVYGRPSRHLLSFNAPEHEDSGACPACSGIGVGRRLLEDALVAHPERAMADGAFAIWTPKNYKYVNVQHETVEGLRGMRGFSPAVPWADLPASAQALVLDGSGEEAVFDIGPSGRRFGEGRPFPGFRKVVLEKSAATTKIAAQLAPYVEAGPCDACDGSRWSRQARALRVGGYGIAGILGMTFSEVASFASADGAFARAVLAEVRPLVEAIRRHAQSIVSVGLGYLTGDRGMLEVSEGESRRVRLARVLDAGERGLCLLLDEPGRGLHEADLPRLAGALERLRGEHTVVLNEHRERLWSVADWFVEIGPEAGAAGGKVTYAGPPPMRQDDGRPLRTSCPPAPDGPKLTIRGASIHNVQDVDCEIPLGRLTCISGVSGSGKSSFVRGILAPALLEDVVGEAGFGLRRGRWKSVTGLESVGEVVALDQTMPPANRRSLVATFTGVFGYVRKVFGNSPAAKRDGLSASDFGVNAGHGRCSVCLGVGEVEQDGVWSPCPACGGSRYGRAALSVRIAGTNVQELLDTPVASLGSSASTFRIPERLVGAMCDLGIGYITLGRRVDTLSGGEVQRLRLALRLSARSDRPTFFILDEPAVGLHARDVRQVASALERTLDGGRNTVVIVEHDLRLIRSADWVIEFGPGSGPEGGQIVFAGPPARLAKASTPTGRALAGDLPSWERPPAERQVSSNTIEVTPTKRMARTTALLRALVSGEAAESPESDEPVVEPAVVVTERFWAGRDVWEVAGLDREIPKLLLDVQRVSGADVFADLLDRWESDPGSWLAIHPFLTEMQIWGADIPESLRRSVASHIARERLRLVAVEGASLPADADVRHVRATGERFVPEQDGTPARRRVLADAFAVGARYVELRGPEGQLRATATDRLLDLEAALVAPMALLPVHFSRVDPRGRCPMCDGTRTVPVIPDALVVGDRQVPPDHPRFLTPEAAAVLKGVVRNEWTPFARRLAREGLWDPTVPFDSLSLEAQSVVRFGFWSRPGAGSFLKTPGADPGEVKSWLRWNGLYRHVLAQVDRSRDAEWGHRVRERAHLVRCPRCEGSGLHPYAELLRVDSLSLAACSRHDRPSQILDLVRAVEPRTPRQRQTRERLVHCLTPLSRQHGQDDPVAVVARAVETFTTMEPASPDD